MAASPLIYLTGAPATGKTTVADYVCMQYGARAFSYGQALEQHASLRGISREELRDQSAEVVTPELIAELDESLPSLLREWRQAGPVIIDSHAVTTEVWGLRALPYSPESLRALAVTHVVCLIADGQTLADRVAASPNGRRTDDPWKLEQVNNVQLALATTYAHTLGQALIALDARSAPSDVCRAVASRCGLISDDAPR